MKKEKRVSKFIKGWLFIFISVMVFSDATNLLIRSHIIRFWAPIIISAILYTIFKDKLDLDLFSQKK